MPPLSRRRDLGRRFRGGSSLSARTVRAPRQLISLRVIVGAVALSRRSAFRDAHGAADCGAALALLALSQSCRRVAAACRSAAPCAAAAHSRRTRCCSSPLRVVVGAVVSSLGAVAVARRSRRR